MSAYLERLRERVHQWRRAWLWARLPEMTAFLDRHAGLDGYPGCPACGGRWLQDTPLTSALDPRTVVNCAPCGRPPYRAYSVSDVRRAREHDVSKDPSFDPRNPELSLASIISDDTHDDEDGDRLRILN